VFYFEQLFQTALQGIDGTSIMTTVLELAGSLLVLSFLYGAYQAFAAGGDVRRLAVAGIEYLVLGLVFANYSAIFRSVNGMFNSVADFVYNASGVGDVFQKWLNQLSSYVGQNGFSSLWGLVSGGISGFLTTFIILSGLILFPISYALFSLFYAMYGSVLYVTGPFVLSLFPSRSMGQLARTYLVNLMIFQAWGLIYAVLQVLMSAVNLGSMNAVLNANGVLNSFIGSSQMMLLALASVLFSISIALIPSIASRIVRGDVGSTMMTMVGAMTSAASAVASLAAASFVGVGEGVLASGAAGGDPPPPPPPGGPEAATSATVPVGASSSSGGTTAGVVSTSTSPTPPSATRTDDGSTATPTSGSSVTPSSPATPPSPPPPSASPWRSSSRPGQYRGFNAPHAAAWYVGYSLGSAYRGLKGRNSR
jgi:hypothetical protein